MKSIRTKHITVMGGGTGTSVVLAGLKQYRYQLNAVVSVADSGGSTGRLRDEFGFQPVGDLRQALSALAADADQTWIRDLLLYRFSKGSGLEGHNLGNLILTALQDMTQSTAKALEVAANIFRLSGRIYPITNKKVDLVIEYADGTFIIGEHHLNPKQAGGKVIKKIRLSPAASIYPPAKQCLIKSNAIIIGPGDLYASLMPNLIVKGIKPTFALSSATIIYVVNLMTSFTQTHQMTASDHISIIQKAIGRPLDYVILNNAPIPPAILKSYQVHQDSPVIDDVKLSSPTQIIKAPLIHKAKVKHQSGDSLTRSYLRHDPQKLARIINKILN
jgi:uncharacterized cofD-like protein